MGSKATIPTGEWSCLICIGKNGTGRERNLNIYVCSGIRTHARHSATGKINQRFRSLGYTHKISNGAFIVLQYPDA